MSRSGALLQRLLGSGVADGKQYLAQRGGGSWCSKAIRSANSAQRRLPQSLVLVEVVVLDGAVAAQSWQPHQSRRVHLMQAGGCGRPPCTTCLRAPAWPQARVRTALAGCVPNECAGSTQAVQAGNAAHACMQAAHAERRPGLVGQPTAQPTADIRRRQSALLALTADFSAAEVSARRGTST